MLIEFKLHKMTNELCLLVDNRYRIHKDWTCYDNKPTDEWDIPSYVFELRDFLKGKINKIYINESQWVLNAKNIYWDLVFAPMNVDWIQELDFDDWNIVDEFDLKNWEVEEVNRIKNLLS